MSIYDGEEALLPLLAADDGCISTQEEATASLPQLIGEPDDVDTSHNECDRAVYSGDFGRVVKVKAERN